MNDSLFTDRLKSLTPEYRTFILSGFTKNIAQSFGEALGFSPDQIVVFDNALALYLMFFLSENELYEFASQECGIPREKITPALTAIIHSFPIEFQFEHARISDLLLTSISNNDTSTTSIAPAAHPATAPHEAAPISRIPPASPTTSLRPLAHQPTSDLKADIAEAEAALEALEPLRTMAHDMEVLKTIPPPDPGPIPKPPIYTSTQSALIKEAEHAPIRPNDPAAGPGWSTDK